MFETQLPSDRGRSVSRPEQLLKAARPICVLELGVAVCLAVFTEVLLVPLRVPRGEDRFRIRAKGRRCMRQSTWLRPPGATRSGGW